ncbi:fluoride efflux transporter FluC [Cochlodiniinecator piscidefendens]|uniref:fluoride efflux transporter FluC n=1 Tax=Cochlodiniinecator piscidefendens TaxID=2715756 RepID=UPI001409F31D|nr:CrcB family protein [Cochlodiniinecator piscidefendens]
MIVYIAIFIGGACGSLLREILPPLLPLAGPFTATFAINTLACFVLGALYAQRHRLHSNMLHLGAVGFCGGLSTFSSFVAAVIAFADAGEWAHAFLAPVIEIAVGLLAAVIAERIFSPNDRTAL